jgi:PAS domain S-box-containing protein
LLRLSCTHSQYHLKNAFLVILTILLWFSPFAIASGLNNSEPKRVLVIYSYHEGLPWERLIDDSLRATLALKSTGPIELNVEHADRIRYPDDAYLQNFVNLLRHKYSHSKMDVVIGVDVEATDILLKYGDELFPEVPLVFLTAKRITLQRDSLKPNMTSLLWGLDINGTADLIYKIQPETRQILIITGSSLGDRAVKDLARKTLHGYPNQVEINYLPEITQKDLMQKVERLPQHSAILYIAFSRDSEGKAFVPREILSDISQKANAPTFGILDTYLGFGIAGDSLLSAEVQGRRCAEICLRIIGGESPVDIVPARTRNILMFDARQLKRWGINEAALPPDSIVRYREFSLWQQYRWQVVGLVVFGLIQTLIIILIWIQWMKRRKAEATVRESEIKYRTVADFTYDWEFWANFDGKLHYVSPSCERISGYTTQEFIDNTSLFREIIVPEDRGIWDEHYHTSRAELKQRELQFRMQKRDGTIRWIEHACQPVYDDQGNPLGFRASNRDITERKLSEVALAESKTFNQTTLDSLKYHIAVLDQEGKILDVNQSWLQFSNENCAGSSDRLGAGINYLTVCRRSSDSGDDYARAALEGIQSVLEGTLEHFELEYPCDSPTQKRWFLMRGTRFRGQQGGVIISHADTTERKLAEIDLQDAYTEIEQLKYQLEAETAYLQEEIKLEHNFESIIGNSAAIQYILFKVEQVAATDTSVLVLGETGTGKELVSRAIHNNSLRKQHPMVKVNCATLPANLIESELFGHEPGAFTGARTRQTGRFEVANGTSIFLDEIGELPLELQTKLLQVLQNGEFERLGSSRTIQVNVRVIAATNRDLEAEVRKGRFREDLFYRLNVFPITVPPLRERAEDIPLLAEFFIEKASKRLGKSIELIPTSVMNALQDYPWPGNVRELENVIERAVINSSGPKLRLADELKPFPQDLPTPLKSIGSVEFDHIVRVLEHTDWKVSGKDGAAEILGLKRGTLRARMQKLGIRKP